MKYRNTYLLGIKNNQIITANVEIRDWNGRLEFSCSFNNGEAFNVDTIDDDYKKDYAEEYWRCMDDTTKINMLQDGDITRDEALQDLIDNAYYGDYHDYVDCSCTDYEITHDGKTINFRSCCGGQYDVREDDDFKDMTFTDVGLFNNIMYYWDKYHLKEINQDQVEEIKNWIGVEEYSNEFDEFIENNIDWVVL